MPSLNDLTAKLHLLTDIPAFTIERTAAELAAAGYLPTIPSNAVSYLDAAHLITALAIGRSPSEAAELLSDYARIPASSIECQFEDATEMRLDDAGIAALAQHTSAFDSPMLFIAEVLEQAADKEFLALTAEIARGPSCKCATFLHFLTENGRPIRRFVEFSAHIPPSGCAWNGITRISGRVFTDIERLFHGPAQSRAVAHDAPALIQ